MTSPAGPHRNAMTTRTTKATKRLFRGEVLGATTRDRGYGERAEITVRCGAEIVWFGTTSSAWFAQTGWGRYGCTPHAKVDRGDAVEFEAAVKSTRDGREAGTTFVIASRPTMLKLERGAVGRERDADAAEAKQAAEQRAADEMVAGAFVAMASAIAASEWRLALDGLVTADDAVRIAWGRGKDDWTPWITTEVLEVKRIVEERVEAAVRAAAKVGTTFEMTRDAGQRWGGNDTLVAGDGWAITNCYWVASDYDGHTVRCWISAEEGARIVEAAKVEATENALRRRYGMAA